MRKLSILALTAAILFSDSAEAQSYVIRPNNMLGQPDTFSRGQVITPQSNGGYVVRQEGLIAGQADFFSRGQVITPQSNGGFKVQREGLISGQPDYFDKGYSISPR